MHPPRLWEAPPALVWRAVGGVRIVESSTLDRLRGGRLCLSSTAAVLCGTVGGVVAGGGIEHTVGVLRHQDLAWVDAWVWGRWALVVWLLNSGREHRPHSACPSCLWGGLFVWVFVFVVCVFVVFVERLCLASCEGHMVDALASRADEGRWSLR